MTTPDPHARARTLVLDRALAPLASDAAAWLDEHLEGCADCAAYAGASTRAVASLRMAAEMPSSTLVRATQRSARAYAAQLREAESSRRLLVVSCVLAAIWGAALQPYLWRMFAWAGAALALPETVWQLGFAVVWLLPGLVAALLLIYDPRGRRMRRSPIS